MSVGVVVIDREPTFAGMALADGAGTVLPSEDGLILLRGEPVSCLEMLAVAVAYSCHTHLLNPYACSRSRVSHTVSAWVPCGSGSTASG